jgi:hypothetical protein
MLQFFERLASGFWDVLRRIAALFLPFLSQGQRFKGWGAGLRWTIRIILLVGFIALLWWINWYFDLSRLTLAPKRWLKDYWLPILGLISYAIIWLAWWLWRLLGPEDISSDFPDIDAAWEEALGTLSAKGIDIADAPLFLVLGRPAAGEEGLFTAAQLQFQVKNAPPRVNAPLHVYANRENGIYITCAGASLLGKQAAILAGQESSAVSDGPEAGLVSVDGEGGQDPFKTLQPKGRLLDVQSLLARAREQGRTPDQLTDQEKAEIRRLIAQEEAEHSGSQKEARPRPLLLKNTEEVARQTARLKHLCHLIMRDRHPYCPLNGVMLLVPFAGSDSQKDADQTGGVCQMDLATVRQTMQVNCPVFTMICDLETAPGFHEFNERFPAEQRQRRVGQRLPLAPDLVEGDSISSMIDRSVTWICSSLVPSWIYKLFRVETAGREDFTTAVRGNVFLYHLLEQVRERQKRLSSILVRGLVGEAGEPLLFGGCYLAGTGSQGTQDQAFIPGVFRRLIENQNYVSWTEAGIREENNLQAWTRYGYLGVAACGILIALGAVGLYMTNR